MFPYVRDQTLQGTFLVYVFQLLQEFCAFNLNYLFRMNRCVLSFFFIDPYVDCLSSHSNFFCIGNFQHSP